MSLLSEEEQKNKKTKERDEDSGRIIYARLE
jgi:hypothetical protein